MSTSRVYVHIGEPKCGTTFLQEVLFNQREEIAQRGVTIPGVDISDHYRAAQDVLEIEQLPDDPGGLWAGSWEALAKVARTTRGTSVITHELICGADDAQAARAVEALQPAEVHVVVTSRDLTGLIPAEWQETVKHKNMRTWKQWLGDVIDAPPERRRPRAQWYWAAHDTAAILRRWSAIVGPDHVHLVTVPRSSAPPNLLWRRFAEVIGVPDVEVDASHVRSNASLGIIEVELLRRVNRRLGEVPLWFYAKTVKANLAHEVLTERPRSARLAIPPERQAWVREQSALRISQISELGINIVGDLDELVAPDAFPAGGFPEDVSDAELLEAAIDALGLMYAQRYERTAEMSRMNQLARDAVPGFLRYVPTKVGRAAAWKLVHKIGRRGQ